MLVFAEKNILGPKEGITSLRGEEEAGERLPSSLGMGRRRNVLSEVTIVSILVGAMGTASATYVGLLARRSAKENAWQQDIRLLREKQFELERRVQELENSLHAAQIREIELERQKAELEIKVAHLTQDRDDLLAKNTLMSAEFLEQQHKILELKAKARTFLTRMEQERDLDV